MRYLHFTNKTVVKQLQKSLTAIYEIKEIFKDQFKQYYIHLPADLKGLCDKLWVYLTKESNFTKKKKKAETFWLCN